MNYNSYQPRGIRCAWLASYVLLSFAAFFWQFINFSYQPSAVQLAGYWLPVSKGMAQVCLLQMFFLLLAVTHCLLRKARSVSCIDRFVPLDDALAFHQLCGYVLVFSGLAHSFCHLCGFFFQVQKAGYNTWRNGALTDHFNGPHPSFTDFLCSVPGWSGCALLLILLLVTPFTYFRKRLYQWFWVSHYAFYTLFIALLLIHGSAAWFYFPQAAFWCGIPYVLYLVDRRRRNQPCRRLMEILQVEAIGSDLVKIEFQNAFQNQFVAGMYVYINVPELSRLEWHPFTIASTPEKENMTIYIAACGDWTRAVCKTLMQHGSATLSIDGPIGSPAQRYLHYSTVICFAGGLGITPFLSIVHAKPEADVYWACRNFEHLVHIGQHHHQEMEENINKHSSKSGRIYRYYTGGGERDKQVSASLSSSSSSSSSSIRLGRPDIRAILSRYQTESKNIAVFCCAKASLERDKVGEMDEDEWSKEQEANRKPGQKNPTSSPGFADRVFYESLLEQNPESKMAKKWCVEFGVLEWNDAEELCKELGIDMRVIKKQAIKKEKKYS